MDRPKKLAQSALIAAALAVGAGLAPVRIPREPRRARSPRQTPDEIKAAADQYRAEQEVERLRREQPIIDRAAERREKRLAKRREIMQRNSNQ